LTTPILSTLSAALQFTFPPPAESRDLALAQILSLTAIAKGLAPADDFFLSLDSDDGLGESNGQNGESDEERKIREGRMAREEPRLVEMRERLMECVGRMIEVWSEDAEVAGVRP
jgi:hypothetical protein